MTTITVEEAQAKLSQLDQFITIQQKTQNSFKQENNGV